MSFDKIIFIIIVAAAIMFFYNSHAQKEAIRAQNPIPEHQTQKEEGVWGEAYDSLKDTVKTRNLKPGENRQEKLMREVGGESK